MWEDPVVKEIHKFREKHAKRFNFDLRAIFYELKEQEKKGGRRIVSLPIKHRKAAAPGLKKNTSLHPTP